MKATTSEKLGFTGRKRRHRRDGDRDRPPALVVVIADARWPTRRRRPRRSPCSISARPRADGRDGRVLHRRAGGRRADRHRGLVGGGRPRLRHLHQRGEAADARRSGRDAARARRGQPRNRRGDGERRAGAFAGRSCGVDHRHRRAGRRHGGEAGRARCIFATRRRYRAPIAREALAMLDARAANRASAIDRRRRCRRVPAKRCRCCERPSVDSLEANLARGTDHRSRRDARPSCARRPDRRAARRPRRNGGTRRRTSRPSACRACGS